MTKEDDILTQNGPIELSESEESESSYDEIASLPLVPVQENSTEEHCGLSFRLDGQEGSTQPDIKETSNSSDCELVVPPWVDREVKLGVRMTDGMRRALVTANCQRIWERTHCPSRKEKLLLAHSLESRFEDLRQDSNCFEVKRFSILFTFIYTGFRF